MAEPNTPDTKCAHPICECKVPAGKKYCSEYCQKAPEIEIHCNCRHPGCT
jgi:hypothetical protein